MGQTQTVGSHCTTVRRDGNRRLSVVYHQTEVVAAGPDGSVTLDSGGYRTHTTKTRMNQASQQYGLGFKVYQKAREWYVRAAGRDVTFFDGMTIRPDGSVANGEA